MPNNDFAPFLKRYQKFIVQNISNPSKVIKIFNYPINPSTTRDLLAIPGVSESDIRASCLKGEINHKIRANEVIVIDSDIDLLQFNLDQRTFLANAGVSIGLTVDNINTTNRRLEDIQLVGTVNNSNQVFTIPSGHFVQSNSYKIIVYLNGVRQAYLDDYIIAESGGVGTGYDTVIMTVAPTTTPTPVDVITADYYVKN